MRWSNRFHCPVANGCAAGFFCAGPAAQSDPSTNDPERFAETLAAIGIVVTYCRYTHEQARLYDAIGEICL